MCNLLGMSKPYVLQSSKDKPQNSCFKNRVLSWENANNNSLNNIMKHVRISCTLPPLRYALTKKTGYKWNYYVVEV